MPQIRPIRELRDTRSDLPLSTWLERHATISAIFALWTVLVVGWSAAAGHSGARLLAYVAPLLASGLVATRPALDQRWRSDALVVGLTTAAALVATLAGGTAMGPLAYFLALALASLYERREPLLLALGLIVVHAWLFGTVVPEAAEIDGVPDALMPAFYTAAFMIGAAALALPWRTNDEIRVRVQAQASQIQDQLAVTEIVVSLDPTGTITNISDHAIAFLGRERKDLVGQSWVDLVVEPDHRENARRGLDELLDPAREPLTAPRFYQFEHAIVSGDGTRRVFRWRATLSTVNGDVSGLVAAGTDITDQRRAQRQLLREQRDLAHLALLAQAVARESDPRNAIVEGVVKLADASTALLVEPAANGEELVVTAATQLEAIGTRVPLAGEPSATAVAFQTGEAFFIADAKTSPMVSQRLRRTADSDFTSYLWQPVTYDDKVAAVLVVGWAEEVEALGTRQTNLVSLAADEAAAGLQRRAALQRWEEAAHTDVLTGVPNRRAFDQLFENAMDLARREEQPIALALMDLNGFKVLNDTEGHAAGDRVLKESAALWLQELRPTDVLARLGGDEFVVLLPNCGEQDADSVAGRLRRALRHEAGCGVGIVVWDREESKSELMHRADEALYADKAEVARHRLTDLQRLETVEATGLLDAPADPELDALTAMVSTLLDVPTSTVTLVTDDKQFFAGSCGLSPELAGARETGLPWSYCQHPATTGRELIVENAREHPLVMENLSTTEGGIQAYAGIPLMAGGEIFGVLCAIQYEPREWTADDLGTLRSIARRASDLIAERAKSYPRRRA